MRFPLIKVCGLTSARDLRAASDAGARAFGLVEHPPSPRAVSAERAAELARLVPEGGVAVAVMVDRSPDRARAWLERTGAGAVQLCGAERAADWIGFPHLILRRVAVGPDGEADRQMEEWGDTALAFVLDHPAGPGGTGRAVDLERAARLAARAPCLLAGGLDAGNVLECVRSVRPAGVDASSRLESEPGVKDPELVHAFVRAARLALEAGRLALENGE